MTEQTEITVVYTLRLWLSWQSTLSSQTLLQDGHLDTLRRTLSGGHKGVFLTGRWLYYKVLPTYLPSYLPTYLPPFLPTFLATFLATFLTYLPTYLPSYLPSYPPSYRPTFPPTFLPTFLPTYLPTFLPTYLFTYPPTYLPTYQLYLFAKRCKRCTTATKNYKWVLFIVSNCYFIKIQHFISFHRLVPYSQITIRHRPVQVQLWVAL